MFIAPRLACGVGGGGWGGGWDFHVWLISKGDAMLCLGVTGFLFYCDMIYYNVMSFTILVNMNNKYFKPNIAYLVLGVVGKCSE